MVFGAADQTPISYVTYKEAKKIINNSSVNNRQEYRKFRKNYKKDNLPSSPDTTYKNEWEGWPKFLQKK